ncbi:MAG TPA: right-handed parallel beta-helix repeat-containing protein [Phycisphaerae bacterium]|nr:right-handed parallel beta-helix repeat-containing protein [Phycisphaerae bacterium]HRY69202.1 right-handed parallel beta-helix repeat-containing protein [Phycisphaerae bacterium]HSA26163.1 right-handed parallel beta-helix repeat-containing protein [Phycisphaerae bacterium]
MTGGAACRLTYVLLMFGVLGAGANPARADEELVIDRDNLVITRSVSIKPGRYRVRDADGNGVLQVKADDVVVDFRGAILAGMDIEGADLSKAEGVGLSVSGVKNVTIRNAKVHGFAFNIRAVDSPGLKLEGCDVSYAKAQRIAAGGRPIEIWLVLRSLDAWRSYGAGLWLESCSPSNVSRCRGTGTQNGLLLVHSAECKVSECDFSYNSGFGIGLWGSCRNEVSWNLIDFVNRPWGGGWGGDSAALVVVGGSHDNYLVGNSMTHSGDGLFLTDELNGGLNEQTRTCHFKGNCNNNIIARNDGSWSTANAFEGTFSFANVYYENRANDSSFGFWLGFSNDSILLRNEIRDNRNDGIAIEHGHGTRIEANTLAGNRGAAIGLWASGPEWLRSLCPSKDIDIRDNVIDRCGRGFRLDNCDLVSVGGNTVQNTPEDNYVYAKRAAPRVLAKFESGPRFLRLKRILDACPPGFRMYREGSGPKGIEWLQPDDFAPRDSRGKLATWRPRDAATLELFPLVKEELRFQGPDWIQVTRDEKAGVYVASARSTPGPGEWKRYMLTVTSTHAGEPQKVEGAFLTAEWNTRWFGWGKPTKLAYDDAAGWARLFASPPLHEQRTRELSTRLWRQGFPPGVPHNDFAILATTQVWMPAGRYRLSTLSDDGIRVFLDGKEVISRWNHHGTMSDATEVDVAEGVHEFVVHYCQEDGASTLDFGWQKLDQP